MFCSGIEEFPAISSCVSHDGLLSCARQLDLACDRLRSEL